MTKRHLWILALLAVALLALFGCGVTNDPPPDDTAETETEEKRSVYESDGTHHWLTGHEDEKEEHTDDGNHRCAVCFKSLDLANYVTFDVKNTYYGFDYQGDVYPHIRASVDYSGEKFTATWYRRKAGLTKFTALGTTTWDYDTTGEPITIAYDTRAAEFDTAAFAGCEYYLAVTAELFGEKQTAISPVITVRPELGTGLPVLYLNTENSAEITSKEVWLSGTLEVDGQTVDLQVKGRGNSSWNCPKKSMSIKLAKKTGFFELPEHKRWVLVANYYDRTLFRNRFVYDMAREYFTDMPWAPHFVAVELIYNGRYEGSYIFGEAIKIDEGRVDLPDISETATLEAGGFIFEANRRNDEAFNYVSDRGQIFGLKDPNDVSKEIEDYVAGIIQAAEDAVYTGDHTKYEKYIDVPSFIDWYLLNEFVKMGDAITWYTSVYMYYDPSDKLIHMGPVWDYDGTCGSWEVYYSAVNDMYFTAPWYYVLLRDEYFCKLVQERWKVISPGVKDYIGRIQDYADPMMKSAEKNYVRWPVLGTFVFYDPVGWQKRTTYQQEVDVMKDWMSRRYEWFDDHMKNTLAYAYSK